MKLKETLEERISRQWEQWGYRTSHAWFGVYADSLRDGASEEEASRFADQWEPLGLINIDMTDSEMGYSAKMRLRPRA